jgi:CHAT domain-containing protein
VLVSASDPGGQFAPLDDARREVDLVETTCRLPTATVRRLDDKEASRSRLIEALRGPSLWHVACHGVFRPEAPGSSGIVLPGTDRTRPDVLTLRDLAGLQLAGLRLAFLSSCLSADNFAAPGRRVLSLPYTLHAAGAETVVGSLWELLDDVAAQFTELFYRHVRLGMPCDEALQRAMLTCRQDDEGQPRPLWDWAGFVLTGDPSPLDWSLVPEVSEG